MTQGKKKLLILLAVAIGGACGTALRYYSFEIFGQVDDRAVTFALNISGSALFGVVLGFKENVSAYVKAMVAVGFCGALTSFSTFTLDIAQAIDNKQNMAALILSFSTVVLCVLMAGIGFKSISKSLGKS